jgi:hypothetical protein
MVVLVIMTLAVAVMLFGVAVIVILAAPVVGRRLPGRSAAGVAVRLAGGLSLSV